MSKTITIDEEGFFLTQDGIRINDETIGRQMLETLSIDDYGVIHMTSDGEDIVVQCFDKPYVAKQVHLQEGLLKIQTPYQLTCAIRLNSLCIDEWDRFHGVTQSNIPFVLSRTAQAELFNLAEEFSDDSIQVAGAEIQTPDYYITSEEVNKEPFWSQKYQENPAPHWNLDQPHPELKSFLQQLKINKCRILVPGCGYGHDAALLAERGHLVTAIDISAEAISEAKKLYGHIANLNFLKLDVLNLDDSFNDSFDIIFEHTFYCAVSPQKRGDIVKLWKRCLTETGHILGIFFVVPKRTGPYYGGSEWELREKLQSRFSFRYWTRLKFSPDWRSGAELMVYAQVKN